MKKPLMPKYPDKSWVFNIFEKLEGHIEVISQIVNSFILQKPNN